MTLDEFVTEARRLRADADHAEDALMRFLLGAEADPRIIEGCGVSFVELLKREHIVDPTRFARWKRVALGLGDAASGVGVEALVAAGALADERAQRNVLARARLFEASNGTTISAQSAQRLVAEEKVREIGARHPGGYRDLAAENARLREKLAAAEQTIVALRAELRALKGTRTKARAAA